MAKNDQDKSFNLEGRSLEEQLASLDAMSGDRKDGGSTKGESGGSAGAGQSDEAFPPSPWASAPEPDPLPPSSYAIEQSQMAAAENPWAQGGTTESSPASPATSSPATSSPAASSPTAASPPASAAGASSATASGPVPPPAVERSAGPLSSETGGLGAQLEYRDPLAPPSDAAQRGVVPAPLPGSPGVDPARSRPTSTDRPTDEFPGVPRDDLTGRTVRFQPKDGTYLPTHGKPADALDPGFDPGSPGRPAAGGQESGRHLGASRDQGLGPAATSGHPGSRPGGPDPLDKTVGIRPTDGQYAPLVSGADAPSSGWSHPEAPPVTSGGPVADGSYQTTIGIRPQDGQYMPTDSGQRSGHGTGVPAPPDPRASGDSEALREFPAAYGQSPSMPAQPDYPATQQPPPLPASPPLSSEPQPDPYGRSQQEAYDPQSYAAPGYPQSGPPSSGQSQPALTYYDTGVPIQDPSGLYEHHSYVPLDQGATPPGSGQVPVAPPLQPPQPYQQQPLHGGREQPRQANPAGAQGYQQSQQGYQQPQQGYPQPASGQQALPPVPLPATPPGGPPPAPETSESLNSANLLGERRATPAGGWRKLVYRASVGLIKPGESPTELRRRALISRASTAVAGGHHRVAVMSLKGGVGKTTTTVGLGSTLSSIRGDRVIAVDANPDRGTLSDKVRLETAATVRDLLNERHQIQRYADIRAFTSQASSRLEVLASDRDPAVSEAFSDEDYRQVARVLEQHYSICITDCGTGLLHAAMAAVLGLANQIVLVSSPSVDGARSASATLDWLEAHDYGNLVRNAVVVLSAVRPKSKSGVDLDRLEAHFAARCRGVVRVPYDPHLEEGAEVDLEELNQATQDAYLMLAAAVGDGFAWR